MQRPTLAFLTCVLACSGLLACELKTVEYGAPGGLRLVPNDINTCDLPASVDPNNLDPCPDWSTDVYPIFDNPTYGCTLGGCHGESSAPPSAGLLLPEGEPTIAYNNMREFEASDNSGKLYIDPGNDESYLLCNLNPDPDQTIGLLMPTSAFPLIQGDDLHTIGTWYACGQQLDGGSGPAGSGGGGGMGMGGMDGVGGAGGAGN